MPLIEVKNLSKSYPEGELVTVALDNVSFFIENGDFVAIMGPSGSGKSTLLHILGLLDRPSGGNYLLDGKSFAEFSDEDLARLRNQKLGFVFQQFNLLPNATVMENVMLPLLYSETPEDRWEKLAKTAIGKVGLDNRANHQATQLSGGEKQRVAIARALITSPQVLFADEPTGNLDSKRGMEIMEFLVRLNQAGHTLILITHDPVMARFAKRIIQLKDGRIVTA